MTTLTRLWKRQWPFICSSHQEISSSSCLARKILSAPADSFKISLIRCKMLPNSSFYPSILSCAPKNKPRYSRAHNWENVLLQPILPRLHSLLMESSTWLILDFANWRFTTQGLVWTLFKLHPSLKLTPTREQAVLEGQVQDTATASTLPISSGRSSSKTIFLKFNVLISATWCSFWRA